MSLCCCNFHLEPRHIGKGHKRCVFTLVQAKVLQIFCFLSPYKVAHFPQSHTCNLASIIMKILIKLKFESCSFRILLRKIHFQICIEHSFNHQSTQIESPCCTKKNSKDYAIRNETITIVHFLLSSCDMSLHGKLVAVASGWLPKLFISKIERCTGCGPRH